MDKIKIIAICGKAGSGKDTILKEVIKNSNFHEIISCTTRPPREGEQHGVNYYYLTNEEFAEKIFKNEMLEATVFNDWCYGTDISNLNFDKINIGVFNPAGIELLSQIPKIELKVFEVIASDKIRLIRQLNREENPDVKEIIRRFSADDKDFLQFNLIIEENDIDYTPLINHELSDLNLCVERIAGQTF